MLQIPCEGVTRYRFQLSAQGEVVRWLQEQPATIGNQFCVRHEGIGNGETFYLDLPTHAPRAALSHHVRV